MSHPQVDFAWEVRHKLDVFDSVLDPREISERLALSPMHAWRKGDPNARTGKPPYTFARWECCTSTWHGDTAAFNSGSHVDSLRSLLTHLHSRQSALTAIRAGATVTIITIVHSDSFNIGYGLPPDCARLLADLDIRWYVDAYLAPSPDPMPE